MMEVVAHRAGNAVDTAQAAVGHVDMIELDVHVFRGRVEVRHAKVLRPTRRLWEKWYFLPRGTAGVPMRDVLDVIPPSTTLMIDLKCFLRSSAARVVAELPDQAHVVASTRNWWILGPFHERPGTRVLHSCGTRWQLWWARRITTFGPVHGVCVHERRLTRTVIRDLHRQTPLIFSWGATTADRCLELEQLGLTGVILDDYSQYQRPTKPAGDESMP